MGRKELAHAFSGIITGASTGIGKGLAIKLGNQHKARLVITARSRAALEETARVVEAGGGKCLCIVGDIAETGVREKLVETCISAYGGVDLLVNNAGSARPGLVEKLSTDIWREVFEVNFFAALDCVYRVLPQFQKQGGGKIVNISSVAGKVPFAGSVCYSSSKFALTAMSNGMAAELSGQNIDVLTVCPGWVRTEFFEKNAVAQAKNPTLIAREPGFRGWLMREVLSISCERAVAEIHQALSKGGSHEIVMTVPGKMVERLQGITPQLIAAINRRLPRQHMDASRESLQPAGLEEPSAK